MDLKFQNSYNPYNPQKQKANLAWHIKNRKIIKEMYRRKGLQMIDKPQLVFSDMKEPVLKPQQSFVYQSMKSELTKKGYSDFRFLGQGAQGLVLLAKYSKTNVRYAIKGVQVKDISGNLDKDLSNQVKQEVDILKKCRGSPYVVSLLDSFEGKSFSYLVLTECQGTLKEIVERNSNKRLNEISAIKYAKDIAEGLYYIHSQNCLVNDLKLDNILIDYHGNAVVSDFGCADKLAKSSDYSINQYMGNFLFQAPECFDPTQTEIGKVYNNEYQKLGVKVKQEPSNRSEAFSLGYLIYTLLQGIDFQLALKKHQPLNYDAEFSNLAYQQQLKQIIDGLTQFVPRKRLPIKEALIILKGIISLEFQLDNWLIEMIDENTQEFTSSLQNEVEFVQDLSNQFYPIIKNEQSLIQELKVDHQKAAYEAKIAELQQANIQLKERVSEQEKIINNQKDQLEQSQNQLYNMKMMMVYQPVVIQEIKKKGFIKIEKDKKDKLMEVMEEELQEMINNKEIRLELMEDKEQQKELNKLNNELHKKLELDKLLDKMLVLDSYQREIGYIKIEDFINKMNTDKIMIFYQRSDWQRHIGQVLLGLEHKTLLTYECEYKYF